MVERSPDAQCLVSFVIVRVGSREAQTSPPVSPRLPPPPPPPLAPRVTAPTASSLSPITHAHVSTSTRVSQTHTHKDTHKNITSHAPTTVTFACTPSSPTFLNDTRRLASERASPFVINIVCFIPLARASSLTSRVAFVSRKGARSIVAGARIDEWESRRFRLTRPRGVSRVGRE